MATAISPPMIAFSFVAGEIPSSPEPEPGTDVSFGPDTRSDEATVEVVDAPIVVLVDSTDDAVAADVGTGAVIGANVVGGTDGVVTGRGTDVAGRCVVGATVLGGRVVGALVVTVVGAMVEGVVELGTPAGSAPLTPPKVRISDTTPATSATTVTMPCRVRGCRWGDRVTEVLERSGATDGSDAGPNQVGTGRRSA